MTRWVGRSERALGGGLQRGKGCADSNPSGRPQAIEPAATLRSRARAHETCGAEHDDNDDEDERRGDREHRLCAWVCAHQLTRARTRTKTHTRTRACARTHAHTHGRAYTRAYTHAHIHAGTQTKTDRYAEFLYAWCFTARARA